jgi:hypothetical protein
MLNRNLLLFTAVIAIGVFMIPNALSLFSMQHTFYSGENVSCQKCHQDVYDELANNADSTAHRTNALKSCEGCHRTGNITNVPYNATYNLSYFEQNITTNTNSHAAVTLECIACHQGVDEEITGSDAAHARYYFESAYTTNTSAGLSQQNQSSIALKGANTACIGCHTHIAMTITWNRSTGYNMTADGTGGMWNLTFATNTSYNQTTTKGS